jgi:hypothetical protein
MKVGDHKPQSTTMASAPTFTIAQVEKKTAEQCSAEFGALIGLVNDFSQRFARDFAGRDELTQRFNSSGLMQSALDLLGRIDRFVGECGHHLDAFQRKMLEKNQKALRDKIGELSQKLPPQFQMPNVQWPQMPPLMWPQMPDLDFPRIPI